MLPIIDMGHPFPHKKIGGQHVLPPVHNPIIFGKKAVTAHIHTVSVTIYCFGNTAHEPAFFQYYDLILRIFPQNFHTGSKTRRSGSYNHNLFHFFLSHSARVLIPGCFGGLLLFRQFFRHHHKSSLICVVAAGG